MKSSFTTVLLATFVLSRTALAAEVDKREANQQARISQGVKSGELTPKETAHLENREAHINHEVAKDRPPTAATSRPQSMPR